MSEDFSISMVYQYLDTVIASLDCYTWVFSQGYLNPLLFQGRFNDHYRPEVINCLLSTREQPTESSHSRPELFHIEDRHASIVRSCRLLSRIESNICIHTDRHQSIRHVRIARARSLRSFILRGFSAKCTVIVRLLNFITALWSKYPQDTLRAIDSSFYTTDLTRLILTCVFNPTELGFDINNEEINRKLPERVRGSNQHRSGREVCV